MTEVVERAAIERIVREAIIDAPEGGSFGWRLAERKKLAAETVSKILKILAQRASTAPDTPAPSVSKTGPFPDPIWGQRGLGPSPLNRHTDDIAAEAFAEAMKDKLSKKRAEGRGGWDDKEACSNEFLSRLLREHVEKGDPVDVANLAMMIHQRGEKIGLGLSMPGVPDGWKLVPVEPDDGMIEAGEEEISSAISQARAATIYDAMLAAAPEPPVQEPLTMSMFASRADLEAEQEKRAKAAQPVSSKPVAWLYTVQWDTAEFMRISRQYVEVAGDIDAVMPLYAHPAPVKEAVEALMAAIRAMKLACFIIEKHGVMPNDSWKSGFDKDLETAEAALASLTKE